MCAEIASGLSAAKDGSVGKSEQRRLDPNNEDTIDDRCLFVKVPVSARGFLLDPTMTCLFSILGP